MRYYLATDNQLRHIFNHEKDCPTHILSGVVTEMINRNLLNGYVLYAIESTKIFLEKEDLLQIGLIEIYNKAAAFKPGMATPKTFFITCVRQKMMKLIEEQQTEKRKVNHEAIKGEQLEDFLIQSPINVEQYVVNKLAVEEYLSDLREKEKTALLMKSQGYDLEEIAEIIGFEHGTSVSRLIRHSYAKIRKKVSA